MRARKGPKSPKLDASVGEADQVLSAQHRRHRELPRSRNRCRERRSSDVCNRLRAIIVLGEDLAPCLGGPVRRLAGTHPGHPRFRSQLLGLVAAEPARTRLRRAGADRKSTRLNSSHVAISYAVFCLKKKTITTTLSVL